MWIGYSPSINRFANILRKHTLCVQRAGGFSIISYALPAAPTATPATNITLLLGLSLP